MGETISCGNCGAAADNDDNYCGERGQRLGQTPASTDQPTVGETSAAQPRNDSPAAASAAVVEDGAGVWGRGWLKGIGEDWAVASCALFSLASLIVIFAWLNRSHSFQFAAHVSLIALVVLVPFGTLALSYLHPIFPGWAAVLVAV